MQKIQDIINSYNLMKAIIFANKVLPYIKMNLSYKYLKAKYLNLYKNNLYKNIKI